MKKGTYGEKVHVIVKTEEGEDKQIKNFSYFIGKSCFVFRIPLLTVLNILLTSRCAFQASIRLYEFVLKTSWRRLSSLSSEDVFKTPWSRPIYSSWRYVFKTSQDVFKTSSRRHQEIFKRCCQDILKTSSKGLEDSCKDFFKTFLRHIIKLNCFCSHVSEKYPTCF